MSAPTHECVALTMGLAVSDIICDIDQGMEQGLVSAPFGKCGSSCDKFWQLRCWQAQGRPGSACPKAIVLLMVHGEAGIAFTSKY